MRDLNMSFVDAYETETSWIVAESFCNACFEWNKETGQTDYLFSFEGEELLQPGLYHQIYPYGRELFFIPGYAKRICAWNMDTGQRSYYAVKEGEYGSRYVDSCRIGEVLWLLPSSLEQPIVKFDMKCRRVEYCMEYADAIADEVIDKKKPVFFRQYARKGTKVYAVVNDSPYLVCIDLDKKKAFIKKTGDYALADVCFDGSAFWFTQWRNDSVIRLEEDTEIAEVYRPKQSGEEFGYSNIITSQGKILLIPNKGNQVREIDFLNKTVKAFCDLPERLGEMEDERAVGWRRFFSYKDTGDVVRLYPNRADRMVDIHVCEKRTSDREFRLDMRWYQEIFQKKFLSTYLEEKMLDEKAEVMETREVDLDAYIVYIEQTKRKVVATGNFSCGEVIHRALDCD